MAYVIIVLIFIYFSSKISWLNKRISALEEGATRSVGVAKDFAHATDTSSDGGVAVEKLSPEALSMHAAKVVPNAAPSPSAPPVAEEPSESAEEKSARWLGRIGIVALLFGVAFFLKYAFDAGWVSPTGRVMLGILAGLSMLGVGHRFRAKYGSYADLWLGGGIGVLYLSIYASFAFYHLVPQAFAFFLMALVTALSLVLAISGGTINIAVLGVVGGFLTPILLSTGTDNLIGLSLYMIILNLGVLGVAWFKKWSQLNYLTFVGTVFLFGGWMSAFYNPDRLAITFFFLTVFFLLFLATSILHHFTRKESSTLGDQIFLVVNAAGYFSVSYGILVAEHDAFLGFFAVLLALVYLAVGYMAYASNKHDRTMNLMLPGIAVVFLTIAIPLQLDGYTVSLSWIIEAVVLTAIGLFIRERAIQMFGWLVLLLGMIGVLNDVNMIHHSGAAFTAFWNTGFFLMCVLIGALYILAWLHVRYKEDAKESRQSMLFTLFLANFFTATMFTMELAPKFHTWESLPWFIESVAVLLIGLYYRSRVVEIFGWLFATYGIMLLLGDLNSIHSGRMIGTGVSEQFVIPGAFANLGFFLMICAIVTTYGFLWIYHRFGSMEGEWKKVAGVLLVLANLLTISAFTSEISFKYDREVRLLEHAEQIAAVQHANYVGNNVYDDAYRMRMESEYIAKMQRANSSRNSKNTAITIFWAFYATLLLVVGFMKRIRAVRLLGLIFFFVTAFKVFMDVYSLGQIYRIISFIVFGLIAVSGSFLYAKYKDRIKEIIYD